MGTYFWWLLGVSAAIAIAERIRPARPAQPVLRHQLGNDLVYLLFNGHFFAVWTAFLVVPIATETREILVGAGLVPTTGVLHGKHPVDQILTYLIVADFMQWCVHNLLHRVPFLWQFHKVHHSVREMDWAANFRFHWMELIVYRSLLYIPVVLVLGGDGEWLMVAYVFSTAWGHFNHANLDVSIGPLRWVFNSPRMHMWHHDASDEGGTAKNFGIVLSVWDWLFRTAYWPRDRAPTRIGYPDDDEMPADLPRQLAFPLTRRSD